MNGGIRGGGDRGKCIETSAEKRGARGYFGCNQRLKTCNQTYFKCNQKGTHCRTLTAKKHENALKIGHLSRMLPAAGVSAYTDAGSERMAAAAALNSGFCILNSEFSLPYAASEWSNMSSSSFWTEPWPAGIDFSIGSKF